MFSFLSEVNLLIFELIAILAIVGITVISLLCVFWSIQMEENRMGLLLSLRRKRGMARFKEGR